jgi:hypothetical protein
MSDGLVLDGVEGRLWRDGRARRHLARSSGRRIARVLGRNGVGKTTLLATVMGIACCAPARSVSPASAFRARRRIAGSVSALRSCRRSARSFRR